MLADVRLALRGLAKHKTFALAAAITMALGTGASTAIFTIVYGVLLRPLPFFEPDRIVRLVDARPGGPSVFGGQPRPSPTTRGHRWRERSARSNRTTHSRSRPDSTNPPGFVAPWQHDAARGVGGSAGVHAASAGTRAGHPDAAIDPVVTMSEKVSASVAQPRFAAVVLAGFALTAITLAGIGLYGVLAYVVATRQRELGVRSALGASRATLIRMVIRQGMAVMLAGTLAGLVGAAAMTRLMRSLLFGVAPCSSWRACWNRRRWRRESSGMSPPRPAPERCHVEHFH